MARQTLLDLYQATCSTTALVQLKNRRDAAVDGVSAKDGKPRRIKGIIGRCANTGYFLGLLNGEVVFTADASIINAFTEMVPVDIPVPAGEAVTFWFSSSSGTALATLTVLVEEPE